MTYDKSRAEIPLLFHCMIFSLTLNLLHKVKRKCVYFRSHAECFLLPWKISEEINRQPMLFHN